MPLSHISADEMLDLMPDANVVVDENGNIRYANQGFMELLGYDRADVYGENIVHFLHNKQSLEKCILDVSRTGQCQNQETLFIHRDGHIVRTIKNVRLLSDSDAPHYLATIRNLSDVDFKNSELEKSQTLHEHDIRQLSHAVDAKEQELHSTKAQLEEILAVIEEIIWYIDDHSMEVRFVSKAVETVFGITQNDFVSKPGRWQEMIYAEDKAKVMAFFAQIEPGESRTIDFRIVRTDGEIRWLNNRVTHYPRLNLLIGVTYDITESKSAEDLIEFLAYHDPLTRLPNRVTLQQEIEKYISIQHSLALLFLDLDNFKFINDSKGHDVGDTLLKQLANRMQKCLPPHAKLIRFGGDEFIVLLGDAHDHADIDRCAKELLKQLHDTFVVQDEAFYLSASIGIAIAPDDGTDANNLIKHADTAMYAAKRAGKNRYRYYQTSMDDRLKTYLDVERQIREGLEQNAFTLFFQPLIDAKKHYLKGFEALLRHQPVHGQCLMPDVFIPIAERSGDILVMSKIIFQEASNFAHQIYKATGTWLPVSVNLSARQFQGQSLLHSLEKCLQTYAIPARALSLEITESVLLKDMASVSQEIETLRESGFRIALDDFGTGYSSLEYLAKLPIDTIKIDKSFIASLFDTPQNEHLVKAITTMAHAMQMQVTAEGVDTVRQADFLQSLGVETLQGHLFATALPPQHILESIARGDAGFTLNTLHQSVEESF